MGFLSRLFKKKEEVKEIPLEKTQEVTNSIPEVITEKKFNDNKCEICNKVIGEDRWKKMQGRYFHKSCFKKKSKEVGF